MPDEPFDLHKAFLHKQKILRTHLETGRDINTHPVAMGDASELRWKEMLMEVLPGRYKVSKGFVVDAAGARSEQIDVIVHDRTYSPLWGDEGDYLYVPAESVYAVFEVKQDHNLAHIKAAAQKAASVRRRTRTQGEFGLLHGTGTKDLFPVLAGLLTVESAWQPAFGDPFYEVLGGLSQEEHLDLGCALTQGSWDLEDYKQPRTARLSVPEAALISFCMNLLQRLQKLGNVGGIDYRAYEQKAGLTRE
jgi:hypothetical protein